MRINVLGISVPLLVHAAASHYKINRKALLVMFVNLYTGIGLWLVMSGP